ncbi:MAG TPA: hypothetical protein VEJ88_03780, partial [Dissulfurispiraceae bacterium]|nr:hypothetical protein [Dissulfurispiraceae bacterium]
GVETYILLASEETIPDPEVLEFEGVKTRGTRSPGASRGDDTPLAKLLHGIGSATRGQKPPAPTNWSIQRVTVKSMPKSD